MGDVAGPFGMFPVRVEAVGLVMGLRGTGSDPAPSPQRAVLVEEMQRRGVANPNTLLASRNASIVLVRGVLRPGIQKGDHFDVEVRTQGRSETTSLRGGYLFETRLAELSLLGDGMVHTGRERGVVHGPLLVDPSADPKKESDRVLLGQARILGGGISNVTRALGLVIKTEHKDVVVSSRVAAAVNKRFHSYKNGIQEGMAKAHTDGWIELAVHPRYKENLERYMQVVRSIAIQETSVERMQRITDLQKKLLRAGDCRPGGRATGGHRHGGHRGSVEGAEVTAERSQILCRRGPGLSRPARGGGAAGRGGPNSAVAAGVCPDGAGQHGRTGGCGPTSRVD